VHALEPPIARTCSEYEQTWRDEGGEQASTLHPRFFTDCDKPALYKTRCNSGQFHAVLSEHFCAHKSLSLHWCRFLQLIR